MPASTKLKITYQVDENKTLFLHPGAVTEELSSYVVVVRRRRFSPPHTYTFTFTYTYTY